MPAFFKEWNKQRIKNKITIKYYINKAQKKRKMTKDNYMGKYLNQNIYQKI